MTAPQSLPVYQMGGTPMGLGGGLDYTGGLVDPAQAAACLSSSSLSRGKDRLRYITDPAVWRQAEMQAAAANQLSAHEGLKGLAALTAAAPLSLSKTQAVSWPDMTRPPPTFGGVVTDDCSHDAANSDDDTSSMSGSGKDLNNTLKIQSVSMGKGPILALVVPFHFCWQIPVMVRSYPG